MTATRPFRFGVTAPTVGSGARWRAFARQAEDLGYSTLVLPDHLNDQLAPMPALAVAAEATTTLRVGPLVLANDFRHPTIAAKELATIDRLSDGRLEWGMGAGWLPPDFEQSGIAFDDAGTRVTRLQEAVGVMKALFGGGPVDRSGAYFHVAGLDGTPKPVQRPHPPLLIGGAADRMLRFAASEADIVGIGPSLASHPIFGPDRLTPAAAMDHQLAVVSEAAGDRLGAIELNAVVWPLIITDGAGEREARAAAAGEAVQLGVDDVLTTPHSLIGTVDQIVEALQVRRERWSVSYWVVPAAAIERFAPVVAALRER